MLKLAMPDEMTAKLQAHADGWRNIVGLSDEQAAEMIRQDRIDILVDLAMHTAQQPPAGLRPQAGAGAGDLPGLSPAAPDWRPSTIA